MQSLPIPEYVRAHEQDKNTVVVFRCFGGDFRVIPNGLHSKFFAVGNDKWQNNIECEFLLFYIDNKELFNSFPPMAQFRDENKPTWTDLMLRFIKERLKGEVLEIIPPKYALEPPPPGELVVN